MVNVRNLRLFVLQQMAVPLQHLSVVPTVIVSQIPQAAPSQLIHLPVQPLQQLVQGILVQMAVVQPIHLNVKHLLVVLSLHLSVVLMVLVKNTVRLIATPVLASPMHKSTHGHANLPFIVLLTVIPCVKMVNVCCPLLNVHLSVIAVLPVKFVV